MSTSGYIAPLYELYTKGGLTLDDLSKHVNLKYHDAVAREVLRGNFEAGVVIDSVASRFSDKGLKVIHISDPIPGLPIVARADAPLEMIQEIKKALLGLDYQKPSHRKILDQWDEEFKYGFAEASVSDYEIIGKMIRSLAQQGIKTP
jgi:phosphonate transport system substrate-binding protein